MRTETAIAKLTKEFLDPRGKGDFVLALEKAEGDVVYYGGFVNGMIDWVADRAEAIRFEPEDERDLPEILEVIAYHLPSNDF
ncbi:hypothetical protein [Magnetospira sp. QH-2]|uniref:hypothetical protein n=1 Tax=Magnetospira sp. (strain QH-2) TaxID=1288970 RepID=UPI0011DD43C6|nr:hypothetical protein [Magnetospira sp. QH-2]